MNARKMRSREIESMLTNLKKRFGLDPKLFEDYDFFINNKNKIFILTKKASVMIESYPKRLTNIGMLFARKNGNIKPSSNMIQVFGKSARKSVMDLNRARTRIYVEGFDIEFREEIQEKDGYVILRYGEYNIGCGLFREMNIKNVIPKAKRTRLQFL